MFEVQEMSTFDRKVLVFLPKGDAGYTQGEFVATFKVTPPEKVTEMVDEQATIDEVLEEVLVRVSGIGKNGEEMPADEQLALVRRNPFLSSAAFKKFFEVTQGGGPKGRAGRKQRGTG